MNVMRGNPSPGRQATTPAPEFKHSGVNQSVVNDSGEPLAGQQNTYLRGQSINQGDENSWATPMAMAYSVGAYIAGLLLLSHGILAFLVGVILLAHSMVIAAFLLHECVHGSLFASRRARSPFGFNPNRLVGGLAAWVTGCCYSDLNHLRDKHLRHHFERADIVAIDYRLWLQASPVLRKSLELGQWLCLPAVELFFHALAIVLPLVGDDPAKRRRVILVSLARVGYFTVLIGLLGWLVLPGYLVAYCVFLTVMGFMDAFQHQYLLLVGLDTSREDSPTQDRNQFPANYFSREYEQQRTFSNLVSRRWPSLNWLVLNFCYHNAHHHRPTEPWYRLPQWHQQLQHEGKSKPEEIPFADQLRWFFRFRVERVMAPATDSLDLPRAPGAAGVSFLTPL